MSTDSFGMLTIFDEIADSHPVPIDLTSGTHESFVVYDGVSRGIAVLARCTWRSTLLGFKLEPHNGELEVRMDITLDKVTHNWWRKKYDERSQKESQRARHVLIRVQGDVVGGFTVAGESAAITHTFTIPGDLVNPGGLLMFELGAFAADSFEGPVNADPVLGLQIDAIRIRPRETTPGPEAYVDDVTPTARTHPQGCVVTGQDPVTLRFDLVEQPPLPERVRSTVLAKTLARGMRKLGVARRAAQRQAGKVSVAPEDVGAAFVVDARRPDGSAVKTELSLASANTLEVRFPATNGREIVFFEVRAADPQRAGFGERVVFVSGADSPRS